MKIVKEKQISGKPQDIDNFVKRIEKKAYELYEKRGRQDGCHLDDWVEAAKIVKAESIEIK